MIPNLNLDNQNVQDIFYTMLGRMSQYASNDMDTSYQEPSVALLELFSLLKDMQQFYLNFVSDNHKLRFGKLLGGEPGHCIPAKTLLAFAGTGLLPRGFPAFADTIRFETDTAACLTDNCIGAVATGYEGAVTDIPLWTKPFYPFGQSMADTAFLYIGFEQDICTVPVQHIFFALENAMPDLVVPLGALHFSFFSSREKWETIFFTDQTQCFSVSGKILFTIPRAMSRKTINGHSLFWIRLGLIQNDFELPPLLAGVHLNAIAAQQSHTLAASREAQNSDTLLLLETYLEQTGKIELQACTSSFCTTITDYTRVSPDKVMLPACYANKSISVLAWDAQYPSHIGVLNGTPQQKIPFTGAKYVQRLQVRINGTDRWEIWARCDDLRMAGPLDHCFAADADYIYFGNDENGAIPPVGEARVIDCVALCGSMGNVRANAVKQCNSSTLQVTNPYHAAGGQDELTPEEMLRIASNRFHTTLRAVTLKDYRSLALAMPSLPLEQALAVCDGNQIALYIKPKSNRPLPVLNEAYKENIRAYMEPFRILTTQLDIRSPQYVGVVLYMDLIVTATAYEVNGQIIKAVQPIIASEPSRFASQLSHGALYGLVQSLPFVKRIDALWLTCGCDGYTIRSGFYDLPQGSMPYLQDIQITWTVG